MSLSATMKGFSIRLHPFFLYHRLCILFGLSSMALELIAYFIVYLTISVLRPVMITPYIYALKFRMDIGHAALFLSINSVFHEYT